MLVLLVMGQKLVFQIGKPGIGLDQTGLGFAGFLVGSLGRSEGIGADTIGRSAADWALAAWASAEAAWASAAAEAAPDEIRNWSTESRVAQPASNKGTPIANNQTGRRNPEICIRDSSLFDVLLAAGRMAEKRLWPRRIKAGVCLGRALPLKESASPDGHLARHSSFRTRPFAHPARRHAGEALANSLDLARHAEALGFHRYLGRRASQHAGHCQRRHQRGHRPHRGRHEIHPRRRRRHHAAQPCAAGDRGAVRAPWPRFIPPY